MKELTSLSYWNSKYSSVRPAEKLDLGDYRQRPSKILIEKIESLGLVNKKILELGAGGSAILTSLAGRNPGAAEFHGLDYSPDGCSALSRLAKGAGVKVQVHCQDLFKCPPELEARFDLVYSLGVVEHFDSLPGILGAQCRYLAPGGLLFTMIPNLAGLLGSLTRRYNPRVFSLHKVLDTPSLLAGHAAAGLEVLSSGYLCSTNFGVLSSCFSSEKDKGWRTYLWLSRVSKAVWLFEDALFRLPGSELFSPYIYVVSRLPGKGAAAGAEPRP